MSENNDEIFSFAELVASERFRENSIPVKDIGRVKAHELSGALITQRVVEAQKVELDDLEGQQEHSAKWAAYSMLGKKPTKAQIKQLRETLSAAAISEIYFGALEYFGASVDAKEKLEKN